MTRDETVRMLRYGARLYPNTFWRSDEIDETAEAWFMVLRSVGAAEAMAAFDRACRVSPDRFPSAYKVLDACTSVQYSQQIETPVTSDEASSKFASLLKKILNNN